MEFEGREKDIRELFESGRLKKPAEPLMKDYEADVWKKIRAEQKGPGVGIGIAFAGAFALALLLAFLFFVRPQFETTAPSPTPLPLQGERDRVRGDDALAVEIDGLVEDLFVLEMLGEAEGLLEQMGAGQAPV